MKFNINKKIFFDSNTLEVSYQGLSVDDIDIKQSEQLLTQAVTPKKTLAKNVRIIRTLFSDCDECMLILCHKDGNNMELVKYYDSQLLLYSKVIGDNYYTIRYDDLGVHMNYQNKNNTIFNRDGVNHSIEEMSMMMEKFSSLGRIKSSKNKVLVK